MKENKNEKSPVGEKIKSTFSAFSEGFLKFIRNPSGIFALFVVVLILLNLVASRTFFRWDITSPKSYSLSQLSKEVVKTVDEPLNIKVFFSDNLQAPYSTTYQYVKDILAEYKSSANENFSYEFFNMDKEENVRLASSFGVQQMQIREIKNNEVGFKNAFMGMVVTYCDQSEVLNGLTSSDGMEYKITNAINRVITNTDALIGLTDGIDATFYGSSNLNAFGINGIETVEPTVKTVIEQLNKKYENRLKYKSVNPTSSEVAALVEKYGIPSYKLQDENDKTELGTLALVLETNEASKVIPIEIGQSLDLSSFQTVYGVQGLEDLSTNIDESLKALASKVTSIAYITGHGELALSDEQNGAAVFAVMLAEHYALKDINLSEKDIPLEVSCAIINGPKTAFSETELYKLDQFLMKGGNLLMFLDPFDPNAQQNEYGMPNYIPTDTGLEKLLDKYGITVNKDYVMDEKCVQQQDQWSGRVVDLNWAPMLESDSLNQKHPITKNLGNVLFYLAGSLDATNAEKLSDEKVSVLATSSKKSWTESEGFILDPSYLHAPASSEEKKSDLAVLVEGKFSSAFDEAPVEEKSEDEQKEETVLKSSTHLKSSTQNGKVLVVSSSFVAGYFLSQGVFQNTEVFVENVVDYMSGNPDLCSMRTKGLSLATLENGNGGLANFVKYFNEIGLAVIVALVGLLILMMRKKRRNQIRLKYNPDDSREEPKKVLRANSFGKGKITIGKGDENE